MRAYTHGIGRAPGIFPTIQARGHFWDCWSLPAEDKRITYEPPEIQRPAFFRSVSA